MEESWRSDLLERLKRRNKTESGVKDEDRIEEKVFEND